MSNSNLSRRKLLERGIQVPLGGLLLAAASIKASTAADAKLCADPKAMDSGQKSIRDSLKYTEMSADQTMTCGVCGFFEGKPDGCGTCMIFTGGPVNPKGHCDAFSAKG